MAFPHGTGPGSRLHGLRAGVIGCGIAAGGRPGRAAAGLVRERPRLKEALQEWVPMGWHLRALSGTESVCHRPDRDGGLRTSRAVGPGAAGRPGETPASYGGTAGILRDHAPASLDTWPGVDALVVCPTIRLLSVAAATNLNQPEPLRPQAPGSLPERPRAWSS